MKKMSRKDPTSLERFADKIDNLISLGFGIGVAIIVILFIYVLVTQMLASR